MITPRRHWIADHETLVRVGAYQAVGLVVAISLLDSGATFLTGTGWGATAGGGAAAAVSYLAKRLKASKPASRDCQALYLLERNANEETETRARGSLDQSRNPQRSLPTASGVNSPTMNTTSGHRNADM
jgi:acyl-CoA hydrolase